MGTLVTSWCCPHCCILTNACWWLLQGGLTKQWRSEKDNMERLQSVKEEIDRVNLEIQGAERDYDLNRAAELKYGTLMDLQKQLKAAEVALEKQVSKAVHAAF